MKIRLVSALVNFARASGIHPAPCTSAVVRLFRSPRPFFKLPIEERRSIYLGYIDTTRITTGAVFQTLVNCLFRQHLNGAMIRDGFDSC